MRLERIPGIVLAAGASSRAGFPKALATLDGETFVQRACGTLRAGGCSDVFVVVAAPLADAIHAAIPQGVRACVNSAPGLGMSSSLATALLLPEIVGADAVIVSLVDHPRVQAATVGALIDFWRSTSAKFVRPTFAGRGGHPYLLSQALFSDFLALPRGSDPRPFFAQHVEAVEVDDPGVGDDVDRLEDVLILGAKRPQ